MAHGARDIDVTEDTGDIAKLQEEIEAYLASNAPLPIQEPKTVFVIFDGPFEEWHDFHQGEARLESLVEEGRYATMLSATLDPNTQSALGLQVRRPYIDVARAEEEI